MKRFFASCGALVVAILLVESVHAGQHHASQRAGHQSGHHTRHHLRQHGRAPRPWRPQLPWQELELPEPGPTQLPGPGQQLPEQGLPQLPQGSGGSDSSGGTYDPVSENTDLNSGDDAPAGAGSGPSRGDLQVGGDIGGANPARQAVTPKGDSQRRPHKVGNGSSRTPRTESQRR
jgi:hypothetical protein